MRLIVRPLLFTVNSKEASLQSKDREPGSDTKAKVKVKLKSDLFRHAAKSHLINSLLFIGRVR